MNTEARYLAKCRTCKRSISALGPKDANGLADRFRSPGAAHEGA